MNKVVAIVMSIILAISLFGCGKSNPTEGKLGDTLKTDLVEVTLTSFGFAEEGVSIDEDHPDIFCTPIPFPWELSGNELYDAFVLQVSGSKYVRKTTEKCVAYLEYTVKYSGKETLMQSLCMPRIRYNDTEHYAFNGINSLALREDLFAGKYDGIYFRQEGDSWEALPMFWSPDTECVCRGVAKIPIEVEENTDAPLAICFALPASDGTMETYSFIIR